MRFLMLVNVNGVDEDTAQELRLAAKFYANHLMHGKIVNNLTIDLDIVSKADEQGFCVDEDDNDSPRFFTIQIRNLPEDDDMFKILAHEMVHVKQYVTRELRKDLICRKDTGFSLQVVWLGKPYKFKKHEHDYWDAPWEIEALGREDSMYTRWLEYSTTHT